MGERREPLVFKKTGSIRMMSVYSLPISTPPRVYHLGILTLATGWLAPQSRRHVFQPLDREWLTLILVTGLEIRSLWVGFPPLSHHRGHHQVALCDHGSFSANNTSKVEKQNFPETWRLLGWQWNWHPGHSRGAQPRDKGGASGKSNVNILMSWELCCIFQTKRDSCQDLSACMYSLIHSSDIYWS